MGVVFYRPGRAGALPTIIFILTFGLWCCMVSMTFKSVKIGLGPYKSFAENDASEGDPRPGT